jgi:hypothetical protein
VDGEATPARRRLPLRRILFGAFALSWRHRGEVARATGLPLLAVIACTLASDLAELGSRGAARWTLYFVYSIAMSWLAISVHRLILLQGPDGHRLTDAAALKRLGRFVGMFIGLYVFYLALVMVLMNVPLLSFMRYVPAAETRPSIQVHSWYILAASILALWPVARLSPIFPAIAVDHPADPITAWQTSRGNGWKLVIVVGALPWALQWIAYALYRDGASEVEFAVLLVLVAIFTIIEIAALSLSYWELTRPEPPPTPPPA